MENIVVSGVTVDKNETKVTILEVPDRPGLAAKIFKELADADILIDMIIQNDDRLQKRTDVSFTVSREQLSEALDVSRKVSKRIKAGRVVYAEDLAKVSVVGVGMRAHAGIAAKMFKALASKRINIEMISTSEIKISCVIKRRHAERAVRAIHHAFGLSKGAK